MTKPGRSSHARECSLRGGMRCAFIACWLVAWAATGCSLQAQVAKVVEAGLGSSHAVSLVLLGPPDWQQLSEDAAVATRAGFVESRTGRVLVDLKERDFCGYRGQSLPHLNTATSTDRGRVAMMTQWKDGGAFAAFEIRGDEVLDLKIELPLFWGAIHRLRPELPRNAAPRHEYVTSEWTSDTALSVRRMAVIDLQDKAGQHDIEYTCVYQTKDGKAVLTGETMELDAGAKPGKKAGPGGEKKTEGR